ncbi:CD1375 family protein [Enterococcus olivae]
MAKIYANLIRHGMKTIEEAPEHLRAEVQAILDADNAE